MLYTLDVSYSYFSTHRLNKDSEFVSLEGRENQKGVAESDMVFNDYQSAENVKKQLPETLELDGKLVDANTNIYDLVRSSVEIQFHRTEPPKQKYFTKEQINEILVSHEDNRHNSLVVDFDGNVDLVPFHEIREPYAVRFETFVAGNGYVGHQWSENELEDLYESLLQGWLIHLNKDSFEYVDHNDSTKADEIIKEINKMF
ncbi:hypothetical protein ACIQ57_23880 [Lysinibacillus xylanilyticus]|uniref:hypothetical protein n=1 Tax=Lysinibacillus xylanilyticus TaxID=582475 RepID=UPI0038263601